MDFYSISGCGFIIEYLICIQINWTAPEARSGCVVFRATIIEHRDHWYKDDGLLTREFCEDEEVQDDYISNILETCCACTEAKYEVIAQDHL